MPSRQIAETLFCLPPISLAVTMHPALATMRGDSERDLDGSATSRFSALECILPLALQAVQQALKALVRNCPWNGG